MRQRLCKDSCGLTLLELALAMAIFAIALGATAQCLISYYCQLDLQERRSTAMEHCRSILNAVREVRDGAKGDFVNGVTAWVQDQEQGEGAYGALVTLMPNEAITTVCSDAATGGAPADPLLVQVTSAFNDMRGRPMTVRLATILTRS